MAKGPVRYSVSRGSEETSVSVGGYMKLLSIDPGTHTGWAVWHYEKNKVLLQEMGESASIQQFYNTLTDGEFNDTDQIVAEDYKIRPADLNKGWSHQWNNGPALQVLGAIDLFATMYSIPTSRNQPAVLPVGCGYIGYKYNKKVHVPNRISAIAHGAWWLVKHGYSVPGGFKLRE
jgi:hypothetical protein